MKIVLIILFFISASSFGKCQEKIRWSLVKSGHVEVRGTTDFVFLSPKEILVARLPENGKKSSELSIYSENKGVWKFDKKKSTYLPHTFHPRQIQFRKFSENGSELVFIADHGTDENPFPGAYPVILKKVKGYWRKDASSEKISKDFTFNLAFPRVSDDGVFLYKANVYSKTSPLYKLNENTWKDVSETLPPELKPGGLCMMTAVEGDFNSDGIDEIFLGGCDQDKKNPSQAQDRILTYSSGKWSLGPVSTFPSRMENSQWGTVFAKVIDFNQDHKKDILIATHDFGFHRWRVLVYINESTAKVFKFSQKLLPLPQESKTEGFVYNIEDFNITQGMKGYLAEVRSVIRDPSNSQPKMKNRLLIQEKDQLKDESECLPETLKTENFNFKRFPDDENKLLLVPYQGDIYTLKTSLN